jgi:hypothetical protein
MANALGASIALNVSDPNRTPAPVFTPFTPPESGGSVPNT